MWAHLQFSTTVDQQGGADIDQFLGKNKASSSGDNVNFEQNSGNGGNDESSGSNQSGGQRGVSGDAFSGDASKGETRERDNDYSGYSGEDCESSAYRNPFSALTPIYSNC
jgi:hypothetical protein